MENEEQISISNFLRFAKTKIILIVTIFVMALAAGFVYIQFIDKPMFSSSVKIITRGYTLQKGNITTYQNVVTSKDFIDVVLEKTNISERTADQLKGEISITGEAGSGILNLTVTDLDGELALNAANTAAEHFIDIADEIGLTNASKGVSLSILEPARTAQYDSEGRLKILIASVVGGLVVALIVVYLIYLADSRIYSEDDLKGIIKARFVNRISNADEIVKVQSNIDMIETDDDRKIVMLTSAREDTNKEKVALKLATFFGASGYKTLFVNVDVKATSKLDEYSTNRTGLMDVVDGGNITSLRQNIVKTQEGFDFLGIGTDQSNISAKLVGYRSDEIFDKLRADYDVVILNTSSIHDSSVALSLAKYTDVNILVATLELSRVKDLEGTVTALGQVDATITGVALIGK